MPQIDLNCDLGESFGVYTYGDDAGIMPFISSANIACGYHGGDPTVIRRAVRLARDHGVAVGAHPSYRDSQGFGLREINVPPDSLEDQVLYQIGAVAGIAKAEGVPLHHVKPHGALYMVAARDRGIADAVASAVAAYDDSLILYGIGETLAAGRDLGLRVSAEAFAGRIYEPDGWPRTRMKPGGLLTDPDEVVAQLVQLANEQTVKASDGSTVELPADTICVHVESSADVALARHIRTGLDEANVNIRPTDRP